MVISNSTKINKMNNLSHLKSLNIKKYHDVCLFCYMIYLALFRPVLGADPGVCFGSVVKSLQGTVVSIPSFHLHLSIARVLDKQQIPVLLGPGGSMSQVVGLPNNSYRPITNTAWVRTRLCKLQNGCTRLTTMVAMIQLKYC